MSGMHIELLEETLADLGISEPRLSSNNILVFAAKGRTENEVAYERTNRILLDELRTRDIGRCTHITGEMRAAESLTFIRIQEEIRPATGP